MKNPEDRQDGWGEVKKRGQGTMTGETTTTGQATTREGASNKVERERETAWKQMHCYGVLQLKEKSSSKSASSGRTQVLGPCSRGRTNTRRGSEAGTSRPKKSNEMRVMMKPINSKQWVSSKPTESKQNGLQATANALSQAK